MREFARRLECWRREDVGATVGGTFCKFAEGSEVDSDSGRRWALDGINSTSLRHLTVRIFPPMGRSS
jgi:hypothetical protein